MKSLYNRKRSGFDVESQTAGESSNHNVAGKGDEDDVSSKRKTQIERFIRYMAPPVLLSGITLGLFLPSYQADPVSSNLLYEQHHTNNNKVCCCFALLSFLVCIVYGHFEVVKA